MGKYGNNGWHTHFDDADNRNELQIYIFCSQKLYQT